MAEPRIGCEVKIIAKSQQKQIDRVISDLDNFARRTKSLSKKCIINIAIVGVNHESDYVGYEGQRAFRHKLRTQEATTVVARLRQLTGVYDELLILEFRATNQAPYPFRWMDTKQADLDYGAMLTRVGEQYQQRFR